MNRLKFLLLGFLPLLSACYGTYHTATPIPTDTFEIVVAPGVIGGLSDTEIQFIPNLEVGLRFGLSDYLDMGVLTTIFGGALDLNVALLNDESFALSVNPMVAVIRIPSLFDSRPALATLGTLGLLADVYKSENVILTLGFKPGVVTPLDEPDVKFTVAGMALAKFRIAKRFALAPTLEVMTPAEALTEGVIFRANVALLF